jgi:hypothetical protein
MSGKQMVVPIGTRQRPEESQLTVKRLELDRRGGVNVEGDGTG